MKRELIEAYCREVLESQQKVETFREIGNIIFVYFDFDERYMYQYDKEISLLDLISFVYSKI